MRGIEIQSRAGRREFHAAHGASGNVRGRIQGAALPVPIDPLRRVGLVVNINPHGLSNSRSQQRTRKQPVVSQRRDEAARSQFNARLADPQNVGWFSLRYYSWRNVRERLEARPDRSSARQLEKRSPPECHFIAPRVGLKRAWMRYTSTRRPSEAWGCVLILPTCRLVRQNRT